MDCDKEIEGRMERRANGERGEWREGRMERRVNG